MRRNLRVAGDRVDYLYWPVWSPLGKGAWYGASTGGGVRVVDRSPSVPHTRPLDDRSASRDEPGRWRTAHRNVRRHRRCQSAAHTRVASCVATSSWVPGLFRRRSLRCWWGCGVVMEGGRGRPAAASGGGVKVQVWRRWVNATRSVMRCDGTAASVGGGAKCVQGRCVGGAVTCRRTGAASGGAALVKLGKRSPSAPHAPSEGLRRACGRL